MSMLLRQISRRHHKCVSASLTVSPFRMISLNPPLASSLSLITNYTRPPQLTQNRPIHQSHLLCNKSHKDTDKIKNTNKDLVQSTNDLMAGALKDGRTSIVIETYLRAEENNIEFNSHVYINVLHMYVRLLKSQEFNLEQVIVLYEKLKAKKSLNFQIFKTMLNISKHQNNYRLALEVNKDYETTKTHNELTSGFLISALIGSNAESQVMKFYRRHRSFMRDNSDLNAKMSAAASASDTTNDAEHPPAHNNSENAAERPPITSVYIPLLSNWKPLDELVHMNLIRMLCRNDRRHLAMETLLDFAEDNNRYLDMKRSRDAEAAASVSGNKDVEEEFPPPSFMTSCFLSLHPSRVRAGVMEVLEERLVSHDADMVRIILSWLVDACEYHAEYKQSSLSEESRAAMKPLLASKDVHLPRGLLLRCLHVAGALGHPEITDLTKQLYQLTDTPLSREEYTQILISYCRGGDVESAIETMVVADAFGVEFFRPPAAAAGAVSDTSQEEGEGEGRPSASEVSLLGPRYLQRSLSTMLSRLDDIDRLYFSLADLTQAGMKPPVLALNALIIAQGNLRFLDRAFAVMQEFDTVFDTKADAHTYHALVEAIAKSRMPRVDNVLHVISDMDDAGFAPDAGCFSSLLETMMKVNDTQGAIGILEHLQGSARRVVSSTSADGKQVETVHVDGASLPALKTLRRLAIHFTKRGEQEQVKAVLEMMRDKNGKKVLPGFFTDRLAMLAKLGVVAGDEGEYEQ